MVEGFQGEILGKLLNPKEEPMDNDSKIAGKNNTQITRFAHKISQGFQKPTSKFMVRMLYGIQASKDVKHSNISRSLNEQIPLIKRREGYRGI